jgi:hypothetical protein
LTPGSAFQLTGCLFFERDSREWLLAWKVWVESLVASLLVGICYPNRHHRLMLSLAQPAVAEEVGVMWHDRAQWR